MTTVEVWDNKTSIEVVVDRIEVIEATVNLATVEVSVTGSPDTYFQRTITNSDLTNGFITLTHGLSVQPTVVAIANNLNQAVYPSDVDQISANFIRISLEGYTPIEGTWKIRIL